MYWDCLFVANLYDDGPITAFNIPAPEVYGTVSIHWEQEFKKATDGINALLHALEQTRQRAADPTHPPTPAEIQEILKNAHLVIVDKLPGPAAELGKAVTAITAPAADAVGAAEGAAQRLKDEGKKGFEKATGIKPPF